MNLSIQEYISLADKNWFKTGGSARFYSEPRTILEFQQALSFAHDSNLDLFILGKGANILISDEGFPGLVIRPSLHQIHHTINGATALVTADSGVSMQNLIEYCLEHSIIGLEEFSGIPSTVGGAVYINLHYFEYLLSNFLVSAQIIEKSTGTILAVDNAWFNFGYNQSTLLNENYYLVNATFSLKKVSELDTAYAKGRSIEIIRHRMKRYPATHTCGSFFRNFHEHEVTFMHNNKKIIFVAYYLDKLGIKGNLRRGGALISYQHANMIINTGTASSSDIIDLGRTMQSMVKENFGIIPQPECRLIGFSTYPLL